MGTVELSLRRAAYFDCGAWTVRVVEDADTLDVFWQEVPVSFLPRSTQKEGIDRDIARELVIILSAALNADLAKP